MAEVQAPPVATITPPDWETFETEVLCPLCEYNLRGISEPRCPECGYRFAWNELLTAQLNQHRYLFEQQDRRRFSAFWKTLVGGIFPGKFWRELKPVQRSHPARIWAYFACAMLIALAGELCAVAVTQADGLSIGSLHFYIAERPTEVIFILATISWPLATILALMIFRVSLSRVRLRPIHAMRCVLYSADCVVWLGFMLIAGSAVQLLLNSTSYRGLRAEDIPILPIFAASFLAVFVYRLCRAYTLYMRFDRSIETVFATQLIVFLAFIAVVVNVVYEPWR